MTSRASVVELDLELEVLQRLLTEVAAKVVADDVDNAVVDSLRMIGDLIQLDRITVWQKADDGGAVALYDWTRSLSPSPEPFEVMSIPFVASRLAVRNPAWFSQIDEVLDPIDRDTFQRQGLRSLAVVPVPVSRGDSGIRCGLAASSTTQEHLWTPVTIECLQIASTIFGQALARKADENGLRRALAELKQLRERSVEAVQRRSDVRASRSPHHQVIGDSVAVKRILAEVDQVAPTSATVLLLGETGSGKEVFAEAIHSLSPRRQRPMIRVNCAAIPTALIESELFGRERGAYTDALTRQIGRFELANHSTLFLDEVGELPPQVQVKLLRVLQERTIERLGSTQPITIDVRIIAATNCNLEQAVAEGSFRDDLFYRLNVFPIVVPPLRERVEDIQGLVWTFIDELSQTFGRPIESISKESMRQLERYPWPGNVRELRNVIERAIILATGPRLTVQLPQPAACKLQTALTLADFESAHIRRMLESTNWRIRGRGGAAERLGLKPTTLESRVAKLGLVRPRTDSRRLISAQH
jgi:formate hydrogenlyase transcriptional activator